MIFSFCLHSSDGKFSTFDHFPCILEDLFSFFCFVVCVLGGGNSRSWVVLSPILVSLFTVLSEMQNDSVSGINEINAAGLG